MDVLTQKSLRNHGAPQPVRVEPPRPPTPRANWTINPVRYQSSDVRRPHPRHCSYLAPPFDPCAGPTTHELFPRRPAGRNPVPGIFRTAPIRIVVSLFCSPFVQLHVLRAPRIFLPPIHPFNRSKQIFPQYYSTLHNHAFEPKSSTSHH